MTLTITIRDQKPVEHSLEVNFGAPCTHFGHLLFEWHERMSSNFDPNLRSLLASKHCYESQYVLVQRCHVGCHHISPPRCALFLSPRLATHPCTHCRYSTVLHITVTVNMPHNNQGVRPSMSILFIVQRPLFSPCNLVVDMPDIPHNNQGFQSLL